MTHNEIKQSIKRSRANTDTRINRKKNIKTFITLFHIFKKFK